MGFTNVAWESRDTEQLARDLTDGSGPESVGGAGAAWARVARELSSVATEYEEVRKRLTDAMSSQSGDAMTRKMEDFGRWLQALSLSAAGNGERAEEAAVAYGAAVMAMPSVSEAAQARASQELVESLNAYNGAVLDGRFADLDQAAGTDQTNAADVMYSYEDACTTLAVAWDQPPPPEVTNGAALRAERQAHDGGGAGGGAAGSGSGSGGAAPPPPPLGAFRTPESAPTTAAKPTRPAVTSVSAASAGGAGGMGGMGGYGAMGALGRGDQTREHESSVTAGPLDGAGEPGANVSAAGASWLPTAESSDAPAMTSTVSWGPSSSIFDEAAVPDGPVPAAFDEEPHATLEKMSHRWVSPAIIGDSRSST